MLVGSLWDQEDSYGAVHTYAALEPKDTANDKVFLVLGPWRHSRCQRRRLDARPAEVRWRYRARVPSRYLEAVPRRALARQADDDVAGQRVRDRHERVAARRRSGRSTQRRRSRCTSPRTASRRGLHRRRRASPSTSSDPQKPVPYIARPVSMLDHDQWKTWLRRDQRAVVDRPDVISFVTEPLTAPVHVAGPPQVSLYASTTGTDAIGS